MRNGRTVPAIAVCSALAVLFVVAASNDVRAQGPDDEPRDAAAAKNATVESDTTDSDRASTVDVSEFSMVLTFHGESDKPFYNLVLTVGPTSIQQNDFVLYHRINEKQARAIVTHLGRSGFFRHAKVTDNQNDPESGPQYLLRVRHSGDHYAESLRWGMETGLRLRGIRKSLDGDVGQSMDRLLDRLTSQMALWESGNIRNGLKTILSAEETSFVAGQPIPIKVDLANIGEQTRTHSSHPFIHDQTSFVVMDDYGRRLPFVSWPAGLPESRSDIAPSTTKVIEQCDLSSYYYLRRPGRYHVAFRGYGLPASNAVHFEVLPADAAKSDGDPMGRLLPDVAGKWTPVGSPNISKKIRPGKNHEEVAGWNFGFPLTPGGFKGSKAVVWLWLTDEPAAGLNPPAEDFLHASEYAGQVSRWHMYLHAPPEALEIWPTAREDIRAALAGERSNPETAQKAQRGDAPIETNRWGQEREGLRIRLAAKKRAFASGESIPITLEAENTGDVPRDFQSSVPHNKSLVVVDETGRPAPYLGGLSQVTLTRQTLAPGQVKELKSFDLSTLYYLRKPGKYSVTSPGVTLLPSEGGVGNLGITGRPSPPFEFEVTADDASSDGDPVGRLLPLVKEKWWLSGSTRMIKLHPGANRREVNGCALEFLYNPTGLKEDAGHVLLWLTRNAAAQQQATEDWPPESESLGKVDRWHLYYHINRNAKAVWPSAKEDIVAALHSPTRLTDDDVEARLPEDKVRDGLSIVIDYHEQLTAQDSQISDEPEVAFASVEIVNHRRKPVSAPKTWWSMQAIVDGKVHPRPEWYKRTWNGPGEIIAGGRYRSVIALSEFGINRASLKPGGHTFQVRIGSITSNTLTFLGGPSSASSDAGKGAGKRVPPQAEAGEQGSQQSLPVTVASTGIDCRLKPGTHLRITDEQTWRRIWFAHRSIPIVREGKPIPQVDFTRFMVIGLVETAELFPNGIAIARISVDDVGIRGRQSIKAVTVDYHSPGKTERFESGAEQNVFGFFVIPRYEPQLILRHKTESGWKEVDRFHALPPGSGITVTVGPQTKSSPISATVIATTPPDAPGLGLPNQLQFGQGARPTAVPRGRRMPVGAINIGFAFDPGQGNYDGVVGSPGDVWNFVDIGTTAVDYMRHPDASSSSARLRITRHNGEWAVQTDNQIYRSYIYHNCQCVDLEATLLDVAPGRYRAYVYAHGDAPNQNANVEVIVGDRSLGKKATSKEDNWAFRSSDLKEGVQFVTFDLDVAAGNDIRIISHRDGSNYSMLNAIQLVPLASQDVASEAVRRYRVSQVADAKAGDADQRWHIESSAQSVFLVGIHKIKRGNEDVREAWVQARTAKKRQHRIPRGQHFWIDGQVAVIETIADESIVLRTAKGRRVWPVGTSFADSGDADADETELEPE